MFGSAGWRCRTVFSSTAPPRGVRRYATRTALCTSRPGRSRGSRSPSTRRCCAARCGSRKPLRCFPSCTERFLRPVFRSPGRRSSDRSSLPRWSPEPCAGRAVRRREGACGGSGEPVAGRARAPGVGPRRVPRRRARLDRDVRERRRARSEGASALRLTADRADARLLARGERRGGEGAGSRARACSASGDDRGDRRLGGGLRLDGAESREPDRPCARATGFELQRRFSTAEPSDAQVEVADAARDACLALEQ